MSLLDKDVAFGQEFVVAETWVLRFKSSCPFDVLSKVPHSIKDISRFGGITRREPTLCCFLHFIITLCWGKCADGAILVAVSFTWNSVRRFFSEIRTRACWKRDKLILRFYSGVLGSLVFAWVQTAAAEISFVQFTDPHLFDSGESAKENLAAFKWCINSVNERSATGTQYAFIVVTGDLGLEGVLHSGGESERKDSRELDNAAKTLSEAIASSRVPVWLFVPGNNDLIRENPQSITNYSAFIRAVSALTPGMVIKDLSVRHGEPKSGFVDERCGTNVVRFIGFDDASFKANNSESDAKAFERLQLNNIADVRTMLLSNDAPRFAFIFYHIPEIEDPVYKFSGADHEALLKKQADRGKLGKDWPLSAWTVTDQVREDWDGIVRDDRVRGLFAGHFHTGNRSVYQGFGWVQNPEKVTASLKKLLIAPPIANKYQDKYSRQARGYREVAIDCELGRVSWTSIVWYEPGVARGEATRQMASLWKWIPNMTLVAFGIILIVVGLSLRNLRIEAPTRLTVWLLYVARWVAIVFGFLLFALAFQPPAHPTHSLGQSDLLVSFVVIPCIVGVVFGGIIWAWRRAIQQSNIPLSSTAHTTMLIAALAAGALVIGFSVLSSLARCKGEDTCRVVCVGFLWGLASISVGASVGFLFGTPRGAHTIIVNPVNGGTPKVSGDTNGSKTNLEEIADWLSKLIVGGTLFESGNIAKWIGVAGAHFATTVTGENSPLWSGVGSAILVYFGLVGFFSGYFPTRLFLNPALRRADEGDRPMVAERTGLPDEKLKALEDAPLNVEGAETEFDAIAKEAAQEITRIPLESLGNWCDIRLWAKAKLSQKDMDWATKAYLKAIEIVPHDAETRLGYATALAYKKSSQRTILTQLEAARDSLMASSNEDLRKNIYKSLVYQYLYLKRPESFLKSLACAREYFSIGSSPVESGGLWVNIACAYGQAFSWLKLDQKFSIKPEQLVIRPSQSAEVQ